MDYMDRELHEECGVFGIIGHQDASQICYYGLHSLQHRGQEAAGICCENNGKMIFHINQYNKAIQRFRNGKQNQT